MSTTHGIAPQHLDQLTHSEHVITWLHTELTRLQAEGMTLAELVQREEYNLRSLLAQHYGIQGEFTLDTKAGTVTTPEDPTPEPSDDRPE